MKRFPLLYFVGKFSIFIFAKLFLGLKVVNKHNIPSKGPFIIASNHISGFDPPLIGTASPRVCHFMAKRELFKNRFFGSILRRVKAIPVNRSGFDKTVIEDALNILKAGEGLVLFPEGTRSRDGRLGRMKSGAGMLALRSGATVVPAHIENSIRGLRNRLVGKNVIITFADPIRPESFGMFSRGKDGYRELADEIRNRISSVTGDHHEMELAING
ncbi:MAG: 1-acyl-sn-glycerol-3-phosphate acyltransferase [candidate division Zixibacteria bacterium CG_4_9_14_3_um_filter_46_8]|nr:MAG: 1-acyl-sn-glycerol-3-phosphate acyltransferase [candidate division Zixibacteria bacterium CG_4_9_14_3_um_filter_46_8]